MISKTYLDGFIPEGKNDDACLTCGICPQKCFAISEILWAFGDDAPAKK